MPFRSKTEEAAFLRKYRNLRLALENDCMEFVDDIFDISPATGTVWPGTDMEVCTLL